MLIENIKIGADPELFLERNGEIVSAEGLVGGTKNNPKPISKDGHFIQEDNVMVEFNIPPSTTSEDFVSNLEFVLEYLKVLASVHNCTLSITPSGELDKKYLQSEQAQTFGCEPDFNVYLKRPNPTPSTKNPSLRTCGGHIHIGYDNPSIPKSEKIVYAMDLLLGLESINLDKDDRRKSMYGKAGAFRFKDYGVEYRTLSNFWLKDQESMKWAFEKTIEAIELANSPILDELVEKFQEQVQEAINTNNKVLAAETLIKVKEIISLELIKK